MAGLHILREIAQMRTIGFVGTGMMGSPIAANLIKAGFDLVVFDAVPNAVDECVSLGARRPDSIAEMASCDIVFIIVKSGAQVREVLLGPEGLAEGMTHGRQLTAVIMSTVSPSLVKQLALTVLPRGLKLVDAPVSGGPILARMGKISFMVGGDVEAVKPVLAILSVIGSQTFHVGPLGSGLAMKLVNNLVGLTTAQIFTEALKIGTAGGLEINQIVKVVNASSGRNWGSENWAMFVNLMQMVGKDSSFKETITKDMNEVMDWAEELHIQSPVLRAACALVESGSIDDDFLARMQASLA